MGPGGRIYQSEDGKQYIAMHADQREEFAKLRKGLVEIYVRANTLFPEMNEEKGRVKKVLKSIDKLKLVGFIN